MGTQRPPMRGRRHDSIALPGGRRVNDPDSTGKDPEQAGKPELVRINIEQEHELKYWSEKFGVSPEEIKSAVAKVGPMVRTVRRHLQHRR